METTHKTPAPSMDAWLQEAKQHPDAGKVGMYLTHNGIVRATPRAKVRQGTEAENVTGMLFSYDEKKVAAAVEDTRRMEGIYYVRVWLNSGRLQVGDDIMYVLIGGDIRPRVIDAMQSLVSRLKDTCVSETELN